MKKHEITIEVKKEMALERSTEHLKNIIKEKQMLIKKLENEIESIENVINFNEKIINEYN